MYICICRAITDQQIREEVSNGACSMQELAQRLGVARTCGKCGQHAKQVLHQALPPQPKAG